MKSCSTCNAEFEVTEMERSLHRRVSPVQDAEARLIPPPKQCPACREQRRMSWRNERAIFVRPCSQSGKRLFSAYPPNKDFPVIDNSLWWRSENDASKFGRAPDFGRGIFEQMAELQRVVPRMSNFNYAEDRLVNSTYSNCAGDLKDCYLTFAASRDERCMYSTYISDCYACVDCFFCSHCTNCYEGMDLQRCHSVHYCSDCRECNVSYFLFDCRGCSNCIGCVGLRNKEFHIFNVPYRREDFERECARMGIGRNSALTHPARLAIDCRFRELLSHLPRRATHGENNENSSGDYVSNTKNCINCFDMMNSRDCIHCTWFLDGNDSADVYAWGEMELCYNISGGGQGMYGCAFTAMSYACKESFYLDLCVYSKNCFACVGLKQKEYCILNKQYSKKEYEQLLPRIIDHMVQAGEWGEFFPGRMSPYGYNASVAADYYPLEASTVRSLGYRWDDYQPPEIDAPNVVDAETILGGDSPAEPGQCALRCVDTRRPYRLTAQEIQFYRENGLPIPVHHPERRHKLRLASRNPRRLWKRFCEQCGKQIATSYDPAAAAQVYCEPCYLEAVY